MQVYNEKIKGDKMPAYNEAVWRNGGIIPREVQCDFGSLPPARSSVEAATTPSRWDVGRKSGDSSSGQRQKIRLKGWYNLTDNFYIFATKKII
jgi:hypothetical protein